MLHPLPVSWVGGGWVGILKLWLPGPNWGCHRNLSLIRVGVPSPGRGWCRPADSFQSVPYQQLAGNTTPTLEIKWRTNKLEIIVLDIYNRKKWREEPDICWCFVPRSCCSPLSLSRPRRRGPVSRVTPRRRRRKKRPQRHLELLTRAPPPSTQQPVPRPEPAICRAADYRH